MERTGYTWNELKLPGRSWNDMKQAGSAWNHVKQSGTNGNEITQQITDTHTHTHTPAHIKKIHRMKNYASNTIDQLNTTLAITIVTKSISDVCRWTDTNKNTNGVIL